MATFGPPLRDSASNFNDVYENTSSRFGIQNARSSVSKSTLTSRPSEDGRVHKPKVRYKGPSEVIDFEQEKTRREQIIANRYYAANQEQIDATANTNASPTRKIVHTSALARARGITFGIVTLSWLAPVYLFWQIPFAILGSIMLGLALQVEDSYILSAIDNTLRSFGSLFGYEYVDLTGMGMMAIGTAAAFGVVSSCIAGFTAILWGLHPLSGNAAGTKKTTFIVGVVGSCIPFANMFPWIIFWVLVMMRHPK